VFYEEAHQKGVYSTLDGLKHLINFVRESAKMSQNSSKHRFQSLMWIYEPLSVSEKIILCKQQR